MNIAYVENDSAEEHLRAIRSDIISTAYRVDSNGKVKCKDSQTVGYATYKTWFRGRRSRVPLLSCRGSYNGS